MCDCNLASNAFIWAGDKETCSVVILVAAPLLFLAQGSFTCNGSSNAWSSFVRMSRVCGEAMMGPMLGAAGFDSICLGWADIKMGTCEYPVGRCMCCLNHPTQACLVIGSSFWMQRTGIPLPFLEYLEQGRFGGAFREWAN